MNDQTGLLTALSGKRLVFCLTSGRSGTGFLAKVIAVLDNIDAFHEPAPFFHLVSRDVQQKPQKAYDFLTQSKLPAIISFTNRTYVETSHLFCMGFVEPMLSLGLVPSAIVLKRPHREVATSLLQLGTVPGRDPKADMYCLRPDDPGVLHLSRWDDLSDYQLCYWYCLEIERRQKLYADMLREHGADVIEFSLSELNTMKGFVRLAQFLINRPPAIRAYFRFYKLRRHKVNTKRSKKTHGGEIKRADFDAMEEQVRQRTGLA